MSRIKELIDALCPDGVEYKKLGKIVTSLNTGLNPRKTFVLNEPEANCAYITGKDIYNNCVNITNKTDFITKDTVNIINKRAKLEDNILLFASTGTGTVGRMAIINHYDGTWNISETLYAIKINTDICILTYIMHYLYSSIARSQFEPKISKGSVPHLKIVDLLNVTVPVPPIEVQQEIVRILDDYQKQNTELIYILTKELSERKKQYELYRDHLISVSSGALQPLNEFLVIKNGKDYKQFKEGNVPVYGSGGVITYIDTFIYNKPSVLIPRKGSIEKLYYIDEPFWTVDTIFYTDIDTSKVVPKYVFYCLQKEHLEKLNTAGGVPSLTQTVLNGVQILLPSLAEQESIVSKLDYFNALCNDISSNLQSEIEARQKQYEYYRDKLLTFKQKEETV